jgi:hypothetical protein
MTGYDSDAALALIERAFWAAAPWAVAGWLYVRLIMFTGKWLRWRRRLETKEDRHER